MTDFLTTCRRCGKEYEPSRESIQAGTWKVCPDCAPKPAETATTEGYRDDDTIDLTLADVMLSFACAFLPPPPENVVPLRRPRLPREGA